MASYEAKVTLAATSGTVTTEIPVRGLLVSFRLVISTGTPTISIAETGKFGRTLWSKASLSSGLHYPSVTLEDATGTALAAYAPPYIAGEYLQATITGATNPSTITIEYQTVE